MKFLVDQLGEITPLENIESLQVIEERYVLRALLTNKWNKKKTCEELRISLNRLKNVIGQIESRGTKIPTFDQVFDFSRKQKEP